MQQLIARYLSWMPREQLVSLGSSMTLHLTCLAVLAGIVLPVVNLPEEQVIAAHFVDTSLPVDAGSDPAATFGDPVVEISATEPDPGGTNGGYLASLAMPESDTLPIADQISPLLLNPLAVSRGTLTQSVGPVVRAGGTGRGLGTGTGDGGYGGGSGSGKGFFGVKDAGESVVFVVDASKSMWHPHPGPAKNRFGRVKLELLYTIARMTPQQRFFIIFFNNGAVPMPAQRLMEATPENKQKYLEWMANVPASGGTVPDDALLLALRLRPDVIYFLTDGVFERRVVPGVTAANVGKVPIHTIGFGEQKVEDALKEIAALNGGRYKFIPPDEDVSPEFETPEETETARMLSR